MRTRPLLALLAAASLAHAAATAAAAQTPAGPPHPRITQTASTNPLAIPFGTVSGEYERALGGRGFALGIGGFTTFTRDPQTLTDGGSEAYRSLQLKLKYYPREDGLRGFAVGVTAGVAHERELHWSVSSYDGSGRLISSDEHFRSRTAPTLGATLDYNFFLGRRRTFLVGLGVGVRRPIGVRSGTGPLDDPLFDPRLQIGFGF